MTVFLSETNPFGLAPDRKAEFLSEHLKELLTYHESQCPEYRRLVAISEPFDESFLESYPFVPVTAFKEFDLKSTQGSVSSVRSSATTSGIPSTIYVDRETRKRQSLSASKILSDYIGAEQRPYIVFDLESTSRGSSGMSARGAAILSLAHFASEFHFVMKQDEERGLCIDVDAMQKALEAIGDRPFIGYGFTYILYQAHVELRNLGIVGAPAHPDSTILHSGGWKRMSEIAVDKKSFNNVVASPWKLEAHKIVDFYGTIEQVGVPYPDCAAGLKHVPYWAEVITRCADTLAPANVGEPGLIQLLNCLPLGSPNHSVLTEDLGAIMLEDGCSCGRRGKGFVFLGRAPKAELRGCSDVTRR